MFKGRHMITQVFDALVANPEIADETPDQLLSREDRARIAKLGGGEGSRARVVCDYIAGLTEGQLVALYEMMFESSGGAWFAHG
jgi:dGTP triphosphohydrolase